MNRRSDSGEKIGVAMVWVRSVSPTVKRSDSAEKSSANSNV